MAGFQNYATRDALMSGLAMTVANEICEALAIRNRATLAVPGGTTPVPFFRHLRQARLEWPRVNVMTTDERWVGEDSPRSNIGLVKRELCVKGTPASGAAVLSMVIDVNRTSPKPSVGRVSRPAAEWLPIDVCVLGMGADMHTASLFPGAAGLEQALDPDGPPLMELADPASGERRVSLCLSALSSARWIHVLIHGQEKAEAYRQAMVTEPLEAAPIRAVLNASPEATVHWSP